MIYYSVHYYVLNVDAGFNSPDQIPSRSHYGQWRQRCILHETFEIQHTDFKSLSCFMDYILLYTCYK